MQNYFFSLKLLKHKAFRRSDIFFFNKILNSIVSIPKYCDIVYDPDPEKSYTKAKLKKYIEYDKENVADNSSISSLAENPELLFPRDEVANEVFISSKFSCHGYVSAYQKFRQLRLRKCLLKRNCCENAHEHGHFTLSRFTMYLRCENLSETLLIPSSATFPKSGRKHLF